MKLDSYRLDVVERAKRLADRKNKDYCGGHVQADPLFNMTMSERWGVVDSAERGIMVRLVDKIARLISLLDRDPTVSDETFDDTIIDAINYLIYLGYKRRGRCSPKSTSQTPSVPS